MLRQDLEIILGETALQRRQRIRRAWQDQVLSYLRAGRVLRAPPASDRVQPAPYLSRAGAARASRRATRWLNSHPIDPRPPAHIMRHLRRV